MATALRPVRPDRRPLGARPQTRSLASASSAAKLRVDPPPRVPQRPAPRGRRAHRPRARRDPSVQGPAGRGRGRARRARRAPARRRRPAHPARRRSARAPATRAEWRLGYLGPAELEQALSEATVGVFPYRAELDQSGALLQTLGAGVPAVVYDVGGLGEVVVALRRGTRRRARGRRSASPTRCASSWTTQPRSPQRARARRARARADAGTRRRRRTSPSTRSSREAPAARHRSPSSSSGSSQLFAEDEAELLARGRRGGGGVGAVRARRLPRRSYGDLPARRRRDRRPPARCARGVRRDARRRRRRRVPARVRTASGAAVPALRVARRGPRSPRSGSVVELERLTRRAAGRSERASLRWRLRLVVAPLVAERPPERVVRVVVGR